MRFAIATRDELWVRGRLVEQRLSHGEAFEDERGIVATDARDEVLVAACDAAMEELRRCVVPDLRMRLVTEARLDGVTSTITASLGAHSVVSDPAHLPSDLVLLRRAALEPEVEARPLPMVWKNGSAAVLLHEASGHPAEQNVQPRDWPEWLQIAHPLALRRASFRDVPLLRMTDLVARQQHAPFDIPEQRLEVLLVDGGAYDPLTDVVTLRIGAADLIEGSKVRRVAPFTFSRPRTSVSLLGATGDPIRYPGVICSREGQELVVGSHAPVMVTA
ncbi:MAG TPA: hypothetical protein VE010_10485 [Thermoanaerobaculia bacterium]|nr:hypothetical protein [Thermoanaerobaculia bacterium]